MAASPDPWLARHLGILAPDAPLALREEYTRRAGAAAPAGRFRSSRICPSSLTIYGLVLTAAGLRVQSGAIAPAASADRRALAWPAYLWDPWFLLWGALVTAALVRSRQSGAARIAPRPLTRRAARAPQPCVQSLAYRTAVFMRGRNDAEGPCPWRTDWAGASRKTMRRWQAGWEGMDQRIGPMMVPPAGRAAHSLDVWP